MALVVFRYPLCRQLCPQLILTGLMFTLHCSSTFVPRPLANEVHACDPDFNMAVSASVILGPVLPLEAGGFFLSRELDSFLGEGGERNGLGNLL